MNHWNLEAVEVEVRRHTKRSVKESMKPYEELWMADQLKETVDIVEAVNGWKNMGKKFFNLILMEGVNYVRLL